MKKVLIVIDMQNDFIDGSLGTAEARAMIPAASAFIHDNPWDLTIFSHDTHFDDYLDTPEGKALAIPHCIYGTWGWEINSQIAASPTESPWIIRKRNFGTMDWKEVLKGLKFKDDFEIHVIGLCTDICVVTNALIMKTQMPYIPITVHTKYCAGTTPEAHEAAIIVMNNCQLNIKED